MTICSNYRCSCSLWPSKQLAEAEQVLVKHAEGLMAGVVHPARKFCRARHSPKSLLVMSMRETSTMHRGKSLYLWKLALLSRNEASLSEPLE